MRNRSEIRTGLRAAFAQQGNGTFRSVLPAVQGVNPRSPSDVLLVRRTVENMVRAGELVKVGAAKEAGARVWLALYELRDAQPAEEPAPTPEPVARLAEVMRFFALPGGKCR